MYLCVCVLNWSYDTPPKLQCMLFFPVISKLSSRLQFKCIFLLWCLQIWEKTRTKALFLSIWECEQELLIFSKRVCSSEHLWFFFYAVGLSLATTWQKAHNGRPREYQYNVIMCHRRLRFIEATSLNCRGVAWNYFCVRK